MASVIVTRWFCCVFVCFVGCSSFKLLAHSGGREIGEQVGSSLRAADAEIAAEASQNSGKSDFQAAYAETLTSKGTVLVNPEVSKVMKQTNELANSLIESKDGLCERRWMAKCPDGWSLAGDDMCIAPASYGGACKKMQSFSGHNIAEKRQVAEDCQSPWPCRDDCPEGRDYSNLCPRGWSETQADGFCDAASGFETQCATSYNFAEMNTKTRQELARTCGFNWECKAECRQDWSQACPEEWTEVAMNPGFCMAPATYSGICSFSVNTTRMSAAQKAAFARHCAVQFPCLAANSGMLEAAAAAGLAPGRETGSAGEMLDGPISLDGRIAAVLKIPALFGKSVAMATAHDIAKLFIVPSGPSRK